MWPTNTGSVDDMEIRSVLIDRGVNWYHRSFYLCAQDCFKVACSLGTVNSFSPQTSTMTDDTLKAWFWLSELRGYGCDEARFHVRRPFLLGQPQLYRVEIMASLQLCLDARILAEAYMHLGFIDPAVHLCDIALGGISCLKGNASKEYSEAVLSMVEIQYSKGPTEVAKAWCLRLLEDHYTVLREKATKFIVGREYGDISSIEISNCNDLILDERVKSRWIYYLKSAVENGNLPAAPFITHIILDFPERYGLDLSPPGDWGQCNFLIPTMSSDSLATISLLLQHRDYLGDASRRSMDDALFTAVDRNFAAAVELLISGGANPNHFTEGCLTGKHGRSCYSDKPINRRTSALGEAIACGSRETFMFLLKTGAAVNVPPKGTGVGDVNIWPPLHIAIRYGYGRQFISTLLEHGADVNYVFRGITPLALAIYTPGHSPAKFHQLGVPSGYEL